MNPKPPPPARRSRLLLTLLAVAVVGVGGWFAFGCGKLPFGGEAAHAAEAAPAPAAVGVEVVHPKAGGIQRVCVQPGTVEPFDSAHLFAKVSGFLAEQTVDIGYRVKVGEVLARIAAPELEKQVEKDAADVHRAEAKVAQATAAVATAEADLGSATAAVAFARAEQASKHSYRAYREKQRARISELAAQKAIDAKLADEQEDQYQAAVGADLAAGESVNSAKQKEAAARAKVEQARADRTLAEAEVAVAKAQWGKSQVLAGYTVIRSPYAGVITQRAFHVGDFIRSADQGGAVPLLTVERTDLMRVVVQVPDRDVPFVNLGDPAVIQIDALPDALIQSGPIGPVAVDRLADAEDLATRTMRVEVHVPNPNDTLRHGMYGRVSLLLAEGTPKAVRVPPAALVGKAEGGTGTVRVVRDGKAHTVPVKFAADSGVEVEIVSGLTVDDQVIVRSAAPLDEGTAVTVSAAKPSAGGH